MPEKSPERIDVPAIDDTEAVYYPEPFDPLAIQHDPDATTLQMQGRKPRPPIVNEAGEIIAGGMFILTKDIGDTTE